MLTGRFENCYGIKEFDMGSGIDLREWYEIAKPYLPDEQKAIMDEVNLITPEAIHLNAFMYEPLIDVSIWALKDIYIKTSMLGSTS